MTIAAQSVILNATSVSWGGMGGMGSGVPGFGGGGAPASAAASTEGRAATARSFIHVLISTVLIPQEAFLFKPGIAPSPMSDRMKAAAFVPKSLFCCMNLLT